jgi:hypothetical protein
MDKLEKTIYFLIFFIIGVFLAFVFYSKKNIHGPKASEEIKKIHYDDETGECFRFHIKTLPCP